jgi:hypothetical protein
VTELERQERTERRAVAAANIRIDAATAEVLRGFDAVDVEALLLKGASIAQWLYAGNRGYTDCDVWVRPGQAEPAERVLRELGFEPYVDEGGLPDWWREHGTEWTRGVDAVCVDLHRTLPGVGVDAESAWLTLSRRTETVVVARYPARALAAPGRALHIALHAAQHGQASGKVRADLERAVEVVEEPVWMHARGLANELAATDAFAAGLRLLPAGAVLADRLELPPIRSVKVALHASTPPPIALGFDQLAQARGLQARARIVARKFVPPPGFMRHWYPPAARSRRQLAFAYVYRPIWLVRNAPRGWRTWRETRRRIRAGRA